MLSDALWACRGMTVNVEIKNLPWEPGFDTGEHLAGQVADLVVSTGRASDVVVSSFWLPTLTAVRQARPEVATGLLVASRLDPAEATGSAVERGLSALYPHIDLVSAPLMDRSHRAGLAVAAWTVNDREQLERAKVLAVDTVITDDVEFALAILGSG
jgi:glycerophosphoryl diester phosphodiesterase